MDVQAAMARVISGSCGHVADRPIHKFVMFNRDGLKVAGVELKSLSYGKVGIVCGAGAVDIHAVLRNVLWEDEHCLPCCGSLLHLVNSPAASVLVRCGPTIEPLDEEMTSEKARGIINEYWTD